MNINSEYTELQVFNAGQQFAVDKDGVVWTVDGWFDEEFDELLPRTLTDGSVNWELWEDVEHCTAYIDVPNPEGVVQRSWCMFRPDSFDRPIEG